MWKDVIELGVNPEITTYEQPDIPTVWTEVFANKKSVRQSEFYQAAGVGMKPELVFEIKSFEYQDNRYIKHEGKMYSVLRTFIKSDIIELVVTAWV